MQVFLSAGYWVLEGSSRCKNGFGGHQHTEATAANRKKKGANAARVGQRNKQVGDKYVRRERA